MTSMQTGSPRIETMYEAAIAADKAFAAALEKAYGSKAGDYRYRRCHADPTVQAAMVAWVEANDVWMLELEYQT